MLLLLLAPVLFPRQFLQVFDDELLLLGSQFLAENVVQISLLPLRYLAAAQRFLQCFELPRGEIIFQDLLRHVAFLRVQLRMAIAWPVARVIFAAPEAEVMPRWRVRRPILGDRVFRGDAAELRVL